MKASWRVLFILAPLGLMNCAGDSEKAERSAATSNAVTVGEELDSEADLEQFAGFGVGGPSTGDEIYNCQLNFLHDGGRNITRASALTEPHCLNLCAVFGTSNASRGTDSACVYDGKTIALYFKDPATRAVSTVTPNGSNSCVVNFFDKRAAGEVRGQGSITRFVQRDAAGCMRFCDQFGPANVRIAQLPTSCINNGRLVRVYYP